MAKSSKIEDYWRQNNIENLLKDITHTLAQRMPIDPAAAIVQHLQKKFPKSFKTSTDANNTSIDTMSKTMAGTLQSQPTLSPRSDTNNENRRGINMNRRLSNQSQGSGAIIIPTPGSAFTDLLKLDATSTAEAPGLSIKNLVLANRLSQQVVKLGKDIRSDRDILEEELIKPTKRKASTMVMSPVFIEPVSGDPNNEELHSEATTKQLIEYKQKIRLENDRRLHRQKLAELARKEREKLQSLQLDLVKSVEHQQNFDGGQKLSHIAPETTSIKMIHKPIAKSKEEEEILNDENIFQPHRQRHRDRQRHKTSTSRSNSPYIHREHVGSLSSTIGKGYQTSTPITHFGICKVCGSMMNMKGDQLKGDIEQLSAPSIERRFSPNIESSSSANVDDWFESPSTASVSQEVTSWKPDEINSMSINPFPRTFFQPINENQSDQRRPISRPLIIADDKERSRQSNAGTPLSESNTFVRTPESLARRSSSSLSNVPGRSPKPMTYLGHTLSIPNAEYQNSDWHSREASPIQTDKN